MMEVKTPEFSAHARSSASSSVIAELEGNADVRTQELLKAFVLDLSRHANDCRPEEVSVDLRKLEFMNSSCFKTFVGWISSLQASAPELQYKIRFLSNPKHHWQRRSLSALRCFAVDLVIIE